MENHLVGLEEFMKAVKKLKDRLWVSIVPVKKEGFFAIVPYLFNKVLKVLPVVFFHIISYTH